MTTSKTTSCVSPPTYIATSVPAIGHHPHTCRHGTSAAGCDAQREGAGEQCQDHLRREAAGEHGRGDLDPDQRSHGHVRGERHAHGRGEHARPFAADRRQNVGWLHVLAHEA
jgi:hypothetical protein